MTERGREAGDGGGKDGKGGGEGKASMCAFVCTIALGEILPCRRR